MWPTKDASKLLALWMPPAGGCGEEGALLRIRFFFFVFSDSSSPNVGGATLLKPVVESELRLSSLGLLCRSLSFTGVKMSFSRPSMNGWGR